jgi:NAD(P)-dependent dehydrogenase (short-subunit alcohol dehydrogenase family)
MPGVAVVTGAGRGFGREIARRLSGRGYDVFATDIDAEAAAATAEEVGGVSMASTCATPGLTGRSPGRRSSAARSRCGSTTPACFGRARAESTTTRRSASSAT